MRAHDSQRRSANDRAEQANVLFNVRWETYSALASARGEHDKPRLSYLDGILELKTSSSFHDELSRMIHSLLFVWAEERGVDLIASGSWTQRSKKERAGLEPDECYTLGTRRGRRPDIAVEVIWTSGSIEKLEIYRRLRIPEAWVWQNGQLRVHVMVRGSYVTRTRSRLLADLDLHQLGRFVGRHDQLRAIREYRALLRASSKH